MIKKKLKFQASLDLRMPKNQIPVTQLKLKGFIYTDILTIVSHKLRLTLPVSGQG